MSTEARRPRRERTVRKVVSVSPAGLEGGQYRPLREADVLRIHQAALQVLERTGVEVMASECRTIFAAAGARVDASLNRVYLPAAMVEHALKVANHDVVLYSRDGRSDLHLRDKRVHLGTGGAAVHVLDLESGALRESHLRDLFDIGRIVDQLENIHFYLRPVVARDVPNDDLDLNTFYACAAATTKHIMGGCYYPQKVAEVFRLGALLAGSAEQFAARPFFSFNLGYLVSPLRFAVETVETLTAAVRIGMPVALVSAPQAGATGPATLAGTLVQVLAEELAGITYVQLLRPGHPLLMGSMPLVTDLRTGSMIGGCAELALMNAAAAQLAHHYRLPIYNSCGITESKLPDVQAGFEKGLTSAVTALAGAQYNHHAAGMLESLLTVAYENYVIDDDINAQVMRLVRGIEVTEETLALDTIHEVCTDGPGHYLGHPDTIARMNSEFQYPHTAHRGSRRDWEEAGALDMRERARINARSILQSSWPQTIPPELDAQVRAEFNILLPRAVMAPGGA